MNLFAKNYNTAPNTTISGLTEYMNYVFNIWAYDEAGNVASATSELAITTNAPPTGAALGSVFKPAGED